MGWIDAARYIVAYSPFGTERALTTITRSRIHGLLRMPAPFSEVLACIRKVARGRRYISSELSARLVSFIQSDSLTKREREVLDQLALGHSTSRMAYELCLAEGTVKAHLKRVMGKLDATNRADALVKAARRGLLSLS